MNTEKRTYSLDERTPNEFKANLIKYAKKSIAFMKDFLAGHQEPIEITNISYLGKEWNLEYLEDWTVTDIDRLTQAADMLFDFTLDGVDQQVYIELKFWYNSGNYMFCPVFKAGQAHQFEKMYGMKLNYLVYDSYNKKYAIIPLEDVLLHEAKPTPYLKGKVAYHVPVEQLSFCSLLKRV